MIIDNKNKLEKISSKLLPKEYKLAITFLCFVNTENESGLVLYSKDNKWKPFEKIEEIKIKKFKSKIVTYEDLCVQFDKCLENENKLLKRTKTAFFDQFDTTCEVKVLDKLYSLDLVNDNVILTKHIVCVVSDVDNFERMLNSEYGVCRVIPFREITKNYEGKTIEDWLAFYFQEFN